MSRTRSARLVYTGYIVCVAFVAAACGPRLMDLPAGTSTPVDPAELAAALAQATAGCASVRTLTAEVVARGSAGGRRVRGRLLAGVASPASVRLEALAPFGQPIFIFVATGDAATLLLPRDDRVLAGGRPEAVLEAVAGVPLDAAGLESTLTGCPAPSDPADPSRARGFGETWIVIDGSAGTEGDDLLYLRRSSRTAPWQLVAVVRRSAALDRRWRAEFTDRQATIPRSIRVTSVDEDDGPGRRFDLRLELSAVEINVPLEAEVFSIRIPESATPISVDELRASGPLAP